MHREEGVFATLSNGYILASTRDGDPCLCPLGCNDLVDDCAGAVSFGDGEQNAVAARALVHKLQDCAGVVVASLEVENARGGEQ